jgi:UDP-glucose 4-epimerase
LKLFKNTLVTGGAGFIGSHLTDRLLSDGHRVTILDNLSVSNVESIKRWSNNSNFNFTKGDLKNSKDIIKAMQGSQIVFHFAANPEVKMGETNPNVHFQENLVATLNLLEAMRKSKWAKAIIFASTSTVYGEATTIPTPEDYGPLVPISTYGASKLGCEALITSYAYTFGIRGLILRLANIVGEKASHGVILDFIRKLQANPNRLEILGDGKQKKSYLYIDDCVEAIHRATEIFLKNNRKIDIYNIGSHDQISVRKIAEIVAEEMLLPKLTFSFTGGVDGGRGWKGDVKNMHLSTEKIIKSGWRPKYSSEQSIRLTLKNMLCNENPA